MNIVTHSWDDWRAIIAALREHGLDYMLDHANRLEQLLEHHGPDESVVTLSMTDDLYHRSYTWARVTLGMPMSPRER